MLYENMLKIYRNVLKQRIKFIINKGPYVPVKMFSLLTESFINRSSSYASFLWSNDDAT